ncbi:MAG: protein phosphatase domain protein [Marmoricola sp.]|nr:protein phosphatase domain protein [Marmoricola sp.]
MLRLSGTGASDVGLVRSNNEDSAFVGPSCVLVADGVGGGAAGEVASATATYAVVAAVAGLQGDQEPVALLLAAVRTAQSQVQAGVALDETRVGMATTLTALVTDGERFAIAHLGDSRGYVLRDDELTLVTRDHTYVQDQLDEGRITAEEAIDHPWRNVVLRSVNGDAEGEPDVTELTLVPGDRIVLATDGLTDLVAEPELAQVLGGRSDEDAVAALIAEALARGGRDNVTCVVATVVEGSPAGADGHLYGAVCDPVNVVGGTDIEAEPA